MSLLTQAPSSSLPPALLRLVGLAMTLPFACVICLVYAYGLADCRRCRGRHLRRRLAELRAEGSTARPRMDANAMTNTNANTNAHAA